MRDLLLQIDTYADPTPPAAVEQAVAFARILNCKLSALATYVDFHVPQNWLAERLLNISELAAAEENKSLNAARSSLTLFERAAKAADVIGEAITVRAGLNGIGECVAQHARTRDLCLIMIDGRTHSQRAVAEEAIFQAGRPTLVFNTDRAPLPSASLKCVAIAWDGSRCAARAVSDAIHVLKAAAEVRVFTIVGEKPSAKAGVAKDLVRHLKLHGVEAQLDEVVGANRSIGASIDDHLNGLRPDLLVMGAYGSPKIKEFILGGATEHVLSELRCPALLSH